MKSADAAVTAALLDDLLSPDRLVTLTKKLLARAQAAQKTAAQDRAATEPVTTARSRNS
jgi:hypothetical protein